MSKTTRMEPTFNLLIDTCVWLDLAKDYQQQAILSALEELIRQGNIALILPRAVIDEFARNKERVIEESSRSLSSTLKRVKEAVEKFGDPRKKNAVLRQLNDVDHRLPTLGEAAVTTVNRIEKLFARSPVIEISDAIKLRAAQRAIDNRAPFHRQRNSINDAILMELYADLVGGKTTAGTRFAFVTHNTKDFSHPNASDKLPHPDMAAYFSRVRSQYFITLGEALRRVQPQQFADLMIEQEWVEEPRRLTKIVDAIELLFNQVWYNRHQVARKKIERGITKIVERETFPVKDHSRRPVQRDVWEAALKAAAKVEKKYGLDNLGPWSDFEWGMINGKLSALRWVLGDEWDMLDT
jgi:PIN domain-containing protein